ncbi:MAG: hypothetical protein KDE50_03775 [Caldilineaceae bacterium]|nr:hypothetical protein [Caldilineaceae bacterium]
MGSRAANRRLSSLDPQSSITFCGFSAKYWIANLNARTVEVYVLFHGEYAALGEFKDAETIGSQVLAGIELATNSLFA